MTVDAGTGDERREVSGRGVRGEVPRRLLAEWDPAIRREDALDVLERSESGLLPDLLPLRHARMRQSPLSFLRGSAAVMATDIAAGPVTGIVTQVCGDCHPANFGLYGSPERRLLFDITDFDETTRASWEYDVKRLAASFVLLAREIGYGRSAELDGTMAMLHSYREHTGRLVATSPIDVWYESIDANILADRTEDTGLKSSLVDLVAAARSSTATPLLRSIVENLDGDSPRFRDDPPTLRRIGAGDPLAEVFGTVLESYPASLSEERQFLLSRYRIVDVALRVVGIGSVGRRCAIVLYRSREGFPLVLQIKEARPSVIDSRHDSPEFPHQGRRIAVGQRMMQSASDIFLGWASDGEGRHYSIRQLRDMKKAVPTAILRRDGTLFGFFAGLCGQVLARGHAKGGEASTLADYIGEGRHWDRCLADFAVSYADQCEQDYGRFVSAIDHGRFPTS